MLQIFSVIAGVVMLVYLGRVLRSAIGLLDAYVVRMQIQNGTYNPELEEDDRDRRSRRSRR